MTNVLPVKPKNIPQELKDRQNWLVWKAVPKKRKDGKVKINKPPFQAKQPDTPASKNNPNHLSDFDTALSAYQNHEGIAGIGYVARPDDGFVFFDLDHCIVDGENSEEAQLAINTVGSYAETSPSGTGVRIIARGKLPGKQFNRNGREMYDGQQASYLTLTGQQLDSLDTIEEAQTAIDHYYWEWSGKSQESTSHSKIEIDIDSEFSIRSEYDLKELGLPELTIVRITEREKEGKRSEAIMTVIHACLHNLIQPAVIADILTNPVFGISAKALEERNGDINSAKQWVKPQIEKALCKLIEDGVIKLNEHGELIKLSTNEQMNDLYGVVNYDGKTVVVTQKPNPKTGYIDDAFIRPGEMSIYMSHEHAYDDKGRLIMTNSQRPMKKFEFWLGWKNRNTYTDVVFEPIPGVYAQKVVNLPKSGRVYNRYKGLNITPSPGCCIRITQHLQNVWCGGNVTLFVYLWHWLARMVQLPNQRAETAIILRSGEGTGKNIIADIFIQLFGSHGMTVTSPEQLTGRFSGHLGQCVFLFANEAVWGGDKKSEGVLKALITDEYRTVEEKYLPVTTVRNYVHLLLATNNDWAAPIGLDDRRYVVLDVDEGRKGDREYFLALKHEIDHGGREALLHELLQTDLSSFDHRELPSSQGESKLIDQLKTADPVIRWWYGCLVDGKIEVESTVSVDGNKGMPVDESNHWPERKIVLNKNDLHRSYLWYCKLHKVSYVQDMAVFMSMLYDKFGKRCFNPGRVGNKRIVKIPDLSTARAIFTEVVKRDHIDWGDE